MIFKIIFLFFPILLLVASTMCYKKNCRMMQNFYLRMVFSHYFRKLYTLLLLMVILVFCFMAYQVQPNKIGAHVMALLALLLFKFSYADILLHRLHDDKKLCTFTFTASLVFIFTPYLYTLGVIVGFLIVASIYYPSSRIIFKAQCPDSGRHLVQCPEDIVNFYF